MRDEAIATLTRDLARALGVPNSARRASLHLEVNDVPRLECEIYPHVTQEQRECDPAAAAALPFIVRLELRPSGVPVERGAGEYRVRFYVTSDARPVWRWAMFAKNGALVAMAPAEGYTRKSAAVRAIEGILGGAVELVEETSPFPFGVGDR